MKKFFTFFIVCFSLSINVFAQNPHPFELGFNAGASWLKSDVKMKKLGGGLGFTFGQSYNMNQTSPLMWGWRFRYLNANAYGQGTQKSMGLQHNYAMNGYLDTLLDYYSSPGYVYDNYKTHMDELSFEMWIGANKIREKTNFYPYVFGGIGFTKAVAKIDQLNANGQRYNYAVIDSNGTASKAEVLSRLNNMYDGSYETLADGNLRPGWKFMPSLGVGLGYEVVKGFSIGLEHKVTWALNDVLDGEQWSNTNTSTGNKDKYHYSSFWIKFSFGRAAKNSATTTTTNDVVTNTTIPPAAPTIIYTNPATSGSTVNQQNVTITGKISNINSAADMSLTMNGNAVSGYTYNSNTDVFSYPATLILGANTFVVTATNVSGTVNSTTTIIYNQPVEVVLPPVVTIASPNQNPFNTSNSSVSVSGTIQNISSKAQMQIVLNGAAVNSSSFSYNTSSHAFSITSNLIQGANTFVVNANNSAGSDSKTITVIYHQEVYAAPAPVVTIVNPSVNPYNTNVGGVTINASVLNITSVGQLSVSLNGGPVPTSLLNFNAASHLLTFAVNLIPGANSIAVAATNVGGSDSKTETIIYSAPITVPMPVVTIVSPAANPFNTAISNAAITATVLNVSSIGQIAVTLNGSPVSTSLLNYNLSSHQLNFGVNLISGANSIVVSATNVSGSDSKTETIIYSQPVVLPAPVVTITVPNVNPSNTSVSAVVFTATVLNVTSIGQISVTLNGGPVPTSVLNFNPSTHQLAFTLNVIPGANTIVVAATNVAGSDSQTQTVIYTEPVVILPPVVTITAPAVNPYTTPLNLTTILASVLNVSSVAEIAVTLNGNALPSGSLNYIIGSHQLVFNVNLITGANVVVVSASNTGGSDSKTETIIHSTPVIVPAPIVTIVNPTANPFNTSVNTETVNATVLNVASMSQITVKLNGSATSAFTFDPSTHALAFIASLISGANTIDITATTSGGTDSKSETIIYTAPVVVLPPVVNFLTPATAAVSTSNPTYLITAKVLNVTGASQISVKVNGSSISAFGYVIATKKLSFSAHLISGNNTVMITATNGAGTDSKTVTINYVHQIDPISPDTLVSPANPTPPGNGTTSRPGLSPADLANNTIGNPTGGSLPQIIFITPSSNTVSTTDAIYVATVKVLDVLNAASIVVKINGVVFTGATYTPKTKNLVIPVSLNPGINTVLIDATNTAGHKSETITITK